MVASFMGMLALITAAAAAQPAAEGPRVQTHAQALAEDAIQYAARYGVAPGEAQRRLAAQEASVAATDAISREFETRLAGIAIQHRPDYRVVVLLTGDEPVAERTISAAGLSVPVTFHTGVKATRAQAVDAMRKHLIDLRSELPGARGAGYDQRTGEVVLLVTSADAQRYGLESIRARAGQLSGVQVRVVINDLLESNMTVVGGNHVDGLTDGKRFRCTSGFVVTDGTRTGIMTAAHCPDDLTYRDSEGSEAPLAFAGQWGLGYQDVQINLSPEANQPLFYANRGAGSLRRLTSWRNLASTRAGDFVCHNGDSSGYSCSEVELTDYAPPGSLCGGPCTPAWVTVKGPNCQPGDSGGPVFSGDVAFGIAKGFNRTQSGGCNFYYYMSTDFLPPPWKLMVGSEPISRRSGRRAAGR